MQKNLQLYIAQAKSGWSLRKGTQQIVTACALLVVLSVFWWLKLTGITIAGEAFCGNAEHVHSQQCAGQCGLEEHIHDASCYSDIRVDTETAADWGATLAHIGSSGSTAEDLIAVARSQLGYQESTRNFQVDTNGIRRGITRYGQWYGNPYGDWSAMFASFCLHYAGALDAPFNSGPEAMRLEWENAGIYESALDSSPA